MNLHDIKKTTHQQILELNAFNLDEDDGMNERADIDMYVVCMRICVCLCVCMRLHE